MPPTSDRRLTDDLGRARRLQIAQASTLIVLALIMAAAAAFLGARITTAQDDSERALRQARELHELRGQMRQGYILFWENRFDGGRGVDDRVRESLQNGVVEVGRQVAASGDEPTMREPIRETERLLGQLAGLVMSDGVDVVLGSPEGNARVQEGRVIINELDAAVMRWAAAATALGEERSAASREMTRNLVLVLVVVAVLMGLVAIVIWMFLERGRSRFVRTLSREVAEHTAVLSSVGDGVTVIDAQGRIRDANRRAREILGIDDHALGQPAGYLADAGIGPDFTGERDVEVHGDDGRTVPVALSSAVLDDSPSGDGGRVHILKDVTSWRDHERELAGLVRQQAALGRVATSVAAESDPQRVFALVAKEIADLLGADAGMVSRFDRDAGRATTVGGWRREEGSAPLPRSIPLDSSSAASLTSRSGRPARVEDTGEARDPLAAAGYAVSASAPIRVGTMNWGALTVAGDPEVLPLRSEERLARFAELVGLAIANADVRVRLALRATTDPLTGLPNHRTFNERLADEVTRAQETDSPLAVMIFDLDHFKDVNDSNGHQTGDHVLRSFARLLSARVRPGQTVARTGGEEFAAILPGCDAAEARRIAEGIRHDYETRAQPDGLSSQTVSIGIADLTSASTPDRLLRLADSALYWAKANGRNRTMTFSPTVVEELSPQRRSERMTRQQAIGALRALGRAVDAKHPGTVRHSERVAAMCAALARKIGWNPTDVSALHEAALVHDVGKIGIPDRLLLQDGLSEDDRRQMEQHVVLGSEIVSDILTERQVTWVRNHHERWDGTGYPDRLNGAQIPLGAQILAVADAWDSMTEVGIQSPKRTTSEALEACETMAGTQFSPRVVEALAALVQDPAEPFGDRRVPMTSPSYETTPTDPREAESVAPADEGLPTG